MNDEWSANVCEQCVHMKGRSPVCFRRCVRIVDSWLNCFWHRSHENEVCLWWVFTCCEYSALDLNTNMHRPQVCDFCFLVRREVSEEVFVAWEFISWSRSKYGDNSSGSGPAGSSPRSTTRSSPELLDAKLLSLLWLLESSLRNNVTGSTWCAVNEPDNPMDWHEGYPPCSWQPGNHSGLVGDAE